MESDVKSAAVWLCCHLLVWRIISEVDIMSDWIILDGFVWGWQVKSSISSFKSDIRLRSFINPELLTSLDWNWPRLRFRLWPPAKPSSPRWTRWQTPEPETKALPVICRCCDVACSSSRPNLTRHQTPSTSCSGLQERLQEVLFFHLLKFIW